LISISFSSTYLASFPEGELLRGDVVLAQKVALEKFEPEALAIAIPFPPMAAVW
jgi:hypothetical protein